MRRALALLAAAVLLVLCGCGGAEVTTTTNAQGKRELVCQGRVHFARTKFLLHSGLAFGAFHRYILKPYRAGTFRRGAAGRRRALVKGAAAALFAVHELKVARNDAVCDGATLHRLAGSVSRALAALSPLQALKAGGGLGAIATAIGAFDRLGAAASQNGAPIKDLSR
jgi:hypothetical protein